MFIGGGGSTDINFSKSVYIILDKNTSLDHTLSFQLSPGAYFIFGYDIEYNGVIYSGSVGPAFTVVHSITGNPRSKLLLIFCYWLNTSPNSLASSQPRSEDIEECTVNSTVVMQFSLISTYCIPSTNSSSDFSGFLMIVQRNDVNIGQLLVNETEQDIPRGPVTVQVRENGNYHVAIFPKYREGGIVHSELAYSRELTVEVESFTNRTGENTHTQYYALRFLQFLLL